MPDSVEVIDKYAFAECDALTEIILSEKLLKIEDCLFYGCDLLTTIEIPDSVTEIGELAFGHSGLQSVTIGKNIRTIGANAFYNCKCLKTVVLDEQNKNFVNVNGTVFSKDHSQLIWKNKKKSCVVSFTLKQTNITMGEYAYGDYSYYYDEDNGYSKWFCYKVPADFVRGTIKFADGFEREGTLSELYSGYSVLDAEEYSNGKRYECEISSDQSKDNVWAPGEHSFSISILDSEPAELKVTIKPEDEKTETESKGEAEHKITWKKLEGVGDILGVERLEQLGVVYYKQLEDDWYDSNAEKGMLLINNDGEIIAQYSLPDLWAQFKGTAGEGVTLENVSEENGVGYFLLKKVDEEENTSYLKLSSADGLSFTEVEHKVVEQENLTIEGDECTAYKWKEYTIAVSNSTEKEISYYISTDGINWDKHQLPFENRYRTGILKKTDAGVYFYTQNESRYNISGGPFTNFQACYFTDDFVNFKEVIDTPEAEKWTYTLGAETDKGFLVLAQQYFSDDSSNALRTCIYHYSEKDNKMNSLWDTYDTIPTSLWGWGLPTNKLDANENAPFYYENVIIWININKGVVGKCEIGFQKYDSSNYAYDMGSWSLYDVYDEETGITRYKQVNFDGYMVIDDVGELKLTGDYFGTCWELNLPERGDGDWRLGRGNTLNGIIFYEISDVGTFIWNMREDIDTFASMINSIVAIEKSGAKVECTGIAVLDEETSIHVDSMDLTEDELETLGLNHCKAMGHKISLTLNGEEVDFGNGFKVTLPVPEDYDGKYCEVYLEKADGTLKKMDAQLDEDGKISFITTESGRFIITNKMHKGGTANCHEKAVCEICGETYGELDMAKHGETEVRGAKEATCTEDGYTGDNHCRDCGEKLETGTVIEAKGHMWDDGTVIKEPTTEEEGKISYHCKHCGKEKIETLDKLPVEIALGDVNDDGNIDANDALAILKSVAKMTVLDEAQKQAANVNMDSNIDANDALMILKYVAKMIDSF